MANIMPNLFYRFKDDLTKKRDHLVMKSSFTNTILGWLCVKSQRRNLIAIYFRNLKKWLGERFSSNDGNIIETNVHFDNSDVYVIGISFGPVVRGPNLGGK